MPGKLLPPFSLPALAPVALLSLDDSETMAVRPIQGAARFGWIVWSLIGLRLVLHQRGCRQRLKHRILGDRPADSPGSRPTG